MTDRGGREAREHEPRGECEMTVSTSGRVDVCCRWCGSERSERYPGRCRRGHPLPGVSDMGTASRWQPENEGAVTNETRAESIQARKLAEAQDRLARDEAVYLADLGRKADAFDRALVRQLAAAVVIREDAERDILAGGVKTTTGRVRRPVALYERQADRVARLVTQLRNGKVNASAPNVAELLASLHGDDREDG